MTSDDATRAEKDDPKKPTLSAINEVATETPNPDAEAQSEKDNPLSTRNGIASETLDTAVQLEKDYNKENSSTTENGVTNGTSDATAQSKIDDPISDINIMKLTEELFNAQNLNLFSYTHLNLQKRVIFNKSSSEVVLDEAPNR